MPSTIAKLTTEQKQAWTNRLLRISVYSRRAFFRVWNEIHRTSETAHLQLLDKMHLVVDRLAPVPDFFLRSPHRFISMVDSEYPPTFFELPQPPLGIFIWGKLQGPYLGIVGSRKPTPYTRRLTREIARLAVDQRHGVVSGGAIGVDGEAHFACLEANGKTVAILGGGFEHLHPRSHFRLFEKIIQSGGALVSEYPPNVAPTAYRFPERNRLIAALSGALFLAQAHERSGSLSTARTALDLGKEIFVLRPPPGDDQFSGSEKLIQAGARCLTDPADLLLELSAQREQQREWAPKDISLPTLHS